MNKRVAPKDFDQAQPKKSVDQLLREFHSSISYRTLEPRMAFDGAAAATAAAVAADQSHPDVASKAHAAATDQNGAAIGAKAAPVAAPADVMDQQSQTAAVPVLKDTASAGLLAAAIKLPVVSPAADAHATIVFIDQHVDNIGALLSTIDPKAEIILIDDRSSGLDQIAAHLAGRTDVGSIQIVSHGSEATLYLGTDTLTNDNLAAHADVLAAIGGALSADGDILIYGCDVARGADGDAFIRTFAGMTGADVGASTDVTGAADLGGNWLLEDTTGAIADTGLQSQAWEGRLAPGTAVLDWQLVGNHTFGATGTTYTIGALTNAITFRTTGTGSIANDSTFATGGTGDPGLQLQGNTTSTTVGQTTEIIFNASAFPLGVTTAQFDIRNIDSGTWDDRVIVQAYDTNGVLLLGTNITAPNSLPPTASSTTTAGMSLSGPTPPSASPAQTTTSSSIPTATASMKLRLPTSSKSTPKATSLAIRIRKSTPPASSSTLPST